MCEIWKEIPGYEGYYEASSFGRIRSVVRTIKCGYGKVREIPSKIRVQRSNNGGYCMVYVSVENKQKNCTVHRLVASTFIPNPENKKEVNHKDGNKRNNLIENLEWVTHAENGHHAWEIGLRRRILPCTTGSLNHKSKFVHQYSLSGDYINTFGSTCEAQRETGVSSKLISRCALMKQKFAMGFVWRYELLTA